jgi:hypothetical protein
MRATGPEIGDRTDVLLSPLKATVPVASSVGWNFTGSIVTITSFARCASVTLNVEAWGAV